MTMTRFKDDFYHKWLYKNLSSIHAVTYQVQEQLKKFIPLDIRPKIEVVYMGTKLQPNQDTKHLKEKYNIKDDDFIVGIIGRIEELKGQYLVIESIAKLNNPNIKALIVGHTMDEKYLDQLKQKTKELNIQNRVIFTGFAKEVSTHMQLCDITVLATPKETFGLVIIESMANKTPVIATNNAGPLEIIDDKKDGLLFDRTVDNLVSNINLIYNDKKLQTKLKANAYEKVKEKFEYTKQLEKLYKVMESL